MTTTLPEDATAETEARDEHGFPACARAELAELRAAAGLAEEQFALADGRYHHDRAPITSELYAALGMDTEQAFTEADLHAAMERAGITDLAALAQALASATPRDQVNGQIRDALRQVWEDALRAWASALTHVHHQMIGGYAVATGAELRAYWRSELACRVGEHGTFLGPDLVTMAVIAGEGHPGKEAVALRALGVALSHPPHDDGPAVTEYVTVVRESAEGLSLSRDTELLRAYAEFLENAISGDRRGEFTGENRG